MEVVGLCQYNMFHEWNLQLFEFCVRCCEQWAARMNLKTEWAGRRLPDFACTTWFREGNRSSERLAVLTRGVVAGGPWPKNMCPRRCYCRRNFPDKVDLNREV